jgi:hypothetical protein
MEKLPLLSQILHAGTMNQAMAMVAQAPGVTSGLSLQEHLKFLRIAVLPPSYSPGGALVLLGVVGTSFIPYVESFQDLCVALSFKGIFKITIRLKTRWVLRTHLLWGPRTGAGTRAWVDSPAEVLPFLILLTPVFP